MLLLEMDKILAISITPWVIPSAIRKEKLLVLHNANILIQGTIDSWFFVSFQNKVVYKLVDCLGIRAQRWDRTVTAVY